MHYEKALTSDSMPELGVGKHVHWNVMTLALKFSVFKKQRYYLMCNEADHAACTNLIELAFSVNHSPKRKLKW